MPKGKDLEARLQRTEQQLALFQKISRLMVRQLSLTEILQGIVSLIVEFSECDSCLVYLLGGPGAAAAGHLPRGVQGHALQDLRRAARRYLRSISLGPGYRQKPRSRC